MKRTANMATMPGREEQLKETILSLIPQFDRIRVYCNGMNEVPRSLQHPKIEPIIGGEDLTDNGKFFALDHIKQPEYFFTVDDDIIYPIDYVEKMIKGIKTFHSIVTIHGRVLKGVDRNYYRGHEHHHCKHETKEPKFLDVPGTGVSAFDTRYFHPKGLANSEYKRMSDIVFGLEASKQNRKIILLKKPENWVKPLYVPTSIWQSEHKTKQENQIKLCNEILKLNRSRITISQ